MNEFKKEHVYIVWSTKYETYYIVRQISQRIWGAFSFTEVWLKNNNTTPPSFLQTNKKTLYEDLKVGRMKEFRQIKPDNPAFRKEIYHIARYGRFSFEISDTSS